MVVHTDCLRDVPDIFENEIGESLTTRTEGLVDTSSSASLAAYINSLQYSLSESPGWFGASNGWKITSGTYCSYNAFSNVDLRVQIKIPGGVDAYIVTVLGERKEVTDELWRECQVSSLLRATLLSDSLAYDVTGLRRVTPVNGPREEAKVIEALMQQFWNGWSLGSNAETQMISTARNFLADGIQKYFSGAGRYADFAAEILAPLAYAPLGGQQSPVRSSADFKGVDPEVASMLAQCYLEGDEEVQAVRVMHQALKIKPSCYPLLYIQSEFLRRKKQLESALTIAHMAVKYAPSEFHAWAKLAEIYIDSKDFKRALLTLNACPMYIFVGRDMPRVPSPRRINYPVKPDILADYNLGESFNNSTHGPVPSSSRASIDSDAPGYAEEMAQNGSSDILRLSAPNLNGTFAHAYKILASIFGMVGWDELLMLRSQVFFMEEEYCNSAVPGAAVDDELEEEEEKEREKAGEKDDDHLPLSALRERALSESKPDIETSGMVKADADTNGHLEETKAETQGTDEMQSETKLDEKPEAESDLQENAAEPKPGSKPEAEPSSEAPAQPAAKGKKKNKKNKGKKAQEKEKESANPEQAEHVEQAEQANGDVAYETIAALGEKMDEVSLSGNNEGDKENSAEDTAPADSAVVATSDIAAPESPFEPVSAPQTAVLEAKDKEPSASNDADNADNVTDRDDESQQIRLGDSNI
ncbi:bud site selection protein, partial [Coemansia erecta]